MKAHPVLGPVGPSSKSANLAVEYNVDVLGTLRWLGRGRQKLALPISRRGEVLSLAQLAGCFTLKGLVLSRRLDPYSSSRGRKAICTLLI